MKIKIFLIVMLSLMTLDAQSVLTLGTGTTIDVGLGADFCTDSIAGSGQLFGSGTFCGNPTGVESQVDNSLPTEYALEQNFPNPFNPGTKICYSIPNVTLSGVEGSRVQLKVYDVLGNEVATLINEEKPAGSYEVNFNASQLSSGIYFYKLQAGSFSETKKMILLR